MHEQAKKWPDIYEYFKFKGLWIFLMENLTSILIGIVISIIPIIVFGCFNFNGLENNLQLTKMFLPLKDGWGKLNGFWKICVLIFSCFNAFHLFTFLYSLPRFIRIHKYFTNTLKISDHDLSTIQWNHVVERILSNEPTCPYSLLTIAQLILREDNYICAIVSNSSIFQWHIPIINTTTRFPITKAFIYVFKLSISGVILGPNGESLVNGAQSIRMPFASTHLKKRFLLLGILLLIFSPFIFFFQIFYLFLEFAQSIRSSTNILMMREWTTDARWNIREYNELPHYLDERLERSYFYANLFLDQFPSEFILPLARMASFISGALLALLLVLGLCTDMSAIMISPLFGDKTVAWLVAILAGIYGATTSLIKRDHVMMSAEDALNEIEKYIHYDFRDESNNAYSWATVDALSRHYRPLWFIFLIEVFGVLLNPILFLFVLPGKADVIVDFVRKNSIQDPELGWICAFSTFDLSEKGFSGNADQREKIVRSMHSFDSLNTDSIYNNQRTQSINNLRNEQELIDFSNNEFITSQISNKSQETNDDLLNPLYGDVNESQTTSSFMNYTPNDFFGLSNTEI